jgi:hypothetical protein
MLRHVSRRLVLVVVAPVAIVGLWSSAGRAEAADLPGPPECTVIHVDLDPAPNVSLHPRIERCTRL